MKPYEAFRLSVLQQVQDLPRPRSKVRGKGCKGKPSESKAGHVHPKPTALQVNFFISAKADSLYHQRIKPVPRLPDCCEWGPRLQDHVCLWDVFAPEVKLRWTQAWRRQNKKGKVEEGGKKKARKEALDNLCLAKALEPLQPV